MGWMASLDSIVGVDRVDGRLDVEAIATKKTVSTIELAPRHRCTLAQRRPLSLRLGAVSSGRAFLGDRCQGSGPVARADLRCPLMWSLSCWRLPIPAFIRRCWCSGATGCVPQWHEAIQRDRLKPSNAGGEFKEPRAFKRHAIECPGSMGAMRPTAYRRNARGLATARHSNTSACRPPRCLPPVTPSPSRPPAERLPQKRRPLARPLAPRRAGGSTGPHWVGPAPVGRPNGRHRPSVAPGHPRAQVRHRPLGAGPHHHRDPATDRGRLQSRSRVEAAALPAAASRPPRHRTRRAGHRPRGRRGLALESGETPDVAGPGRHWPSTTRHAPMTPRP
jgi:hypothetical protein